MTLTPRALERRLKRQLLKGEQGFFAACAPGFEDVLAAEIAALPDVRVEAEAPGGVSFGGPLDTVYHANLRLRSAHRVLLRIDDFLAQNAPTLFDRVSRLPWELYLGFSPSYSLQVSAKRSRLNHQRAVAETVGAGIEAALEPLGLKPEQREDAPLSFHVRFFRDRCTLSLNTSGQHLHKRGYRSLVSEAPIRETLAASILERCLWRRYDTILDPMCGSGTFLVEAALLAAGIAPGLHRNFAFEQAPFFQPSKWERFKREAEARRRPLEVRLIGNELDGGALELAKTSALRAGVGDLILWRQADARSLEPPEAAGGLLVGNLPYGQRLGTPQSVEKLLAAFARRLEERFGGWDFAFVTRDADWLSGTGLEAGSSFPFYNGGLKVELVQGRVRRR